MIFLFLLLLLLAFVRGIVYPFRVTRIHPAIVVSAVLYHLILHPAGVLGACATVTGEIMEYPVFSHRIVGAVVNPLFIIIGVSIRVIVHARALRAIVISNFTAITIHITAIVIAAILARGDGVCAIPSCAVIVPVFS
jgi:hypothetical protein